MFTTTPGLIQWIDHFVFFNFADSLVSESDKDSGQTTEKTSTEASTARIEPDQPGWTDDKVCIAMYNAPSHTLFKHPPCIPMACGRHSY